MAGTRPHVFIDTSVALSRLQSGAAAVRPRLVRLTASQRQKLGDALSPADPTPALIRAIERALGEYQSQGMKKGVYSR